MVEATRYMNILFYLAVAVFAAWQYHKTRGLRRPVVGWVAIASTVWAGFYAWIAFWQPTDITMLTIVSRVAHLPTIATFVIGLNMSRVTDQAQTVLLKD